MYLLSARSLMLSPSVGSQANLDSNIPSLYSKWCDLRLAAVPLWTFLFLSVKG